MQRLKTILRTVLIVLILGLFHYVLPQHDVGRINSEAPIRIDFDRFNRLFFAQSDSGNRELANRDVRLINTVVKKTWFLGFFQRDAEKVMVYRNEDTGWIWPPYFKFDSADLQAEAAANLSPPGEDKWVVITHYGWRNRFFSVYPNAIGIRPVEGPDVRIIPWVNIIFFTFLIFAYFFLRAMWRQFRERSIDPMLEDAGEAWDKVEDHAGAAQERATGVMGRLRAWLATWRKKP